MKIFGIGLNKTGTKSLGACLRTFGFRHLSWEREIFDTYMMHGTQGLIETINNYESFEDWPWPLVYREIDKMYPGSKFILTTRESSDIWYRSLCKHATRTGPNHVRRQIYGFEMPHEHREEHIRFYNRHNDDVRNYFQDRPEALLEVCWERGDGWQVLAPFLDSQAPETPFPHKNKSASKHPVGN